MKTQKEIERIAESKYKYSGDVYIAEIVQTKRVHFTKGYAQCQKDMADKKYTEKDIRKAILYGQTTKNIVYHNDFINSLNEEPDIICPKCKGVNEYSETKNGDYKCAYTDCQHIFN